MTEYAKNGKTPDGVTPDQYVRDRVVTEDLSLVVNRWMANTNAERNNDYLGMDMQKYGESNGALKYLEQLSGVSQRRLYEIINAVPKTTSLWLADRVLSAIDKQHTLRTGEIRVLMNYGSPGANGHPTKGMSQEEWYAYLEAKGYCV